MDSLSSFSVPHTWEEVDMPIFQHPRRSSSSPKSPHDIKLVFLLVSRCPPDRLVDLVDSSSPSRHSRWWGVGPGGRRRGRAAAAAPGSGAGMGSGSVAARAGRGRAPEQVAVDRLGGASSGVLGGIGNELLAGVFWSLLNIFCHLLHKK